jgi:hypothetical protein
MEQSSRAIDKHTEAVLYELWFSYAERIFKRVVQITELDEEQENALRLVALRPNDFTVGMR